MRLFRCQVCSQLLSFENTRCERCGHRLGYLPDPGLVSALEPDGALWQPRLGPGRRYRFCANAEHDACNWLLPSDSPEAYCAACRCNRTIPDLSQPDNLLHWRQLEAAKHRLFYSLTRLGLATPNRTDAPESGLAFDFLADTKNRDAAPVMTGHANGVITIALREADPVEREKMRQSMGEFYRTLLGHFRHETGHYFWDRLVRDTSYRAGYRALFGDERQDYAASLQAHFANGAPPDWQDHFVSTYASSHPWEDFAETWAHYLHIVDTLETAGSFGMGIHPAADREGMLHTDIDFDPYRARDIGTIIESWLPLVFAVNSLNRSMGQPDLYPFVLSPEVIAKLGFVHQLVHAQ